MNTARQAEFPSTAFDPWATPRALTLALARVFVAPRRHAHSNESTVQHLDKGRTTWVAKPLGRRVTCEAGTLWLRFDGEPIDIVLEPGESHRCDKASRLSIHALAPAAVRLA